MFASLSYIQHHTGRVWLLFELYHTNGSVCFCVSYSAWYKIAVLTFLLSFKIVLPSDVIKHLLVPRGYKKKKKKRWRLNTFSPFSNTQYSKHFVFSLTHAVSHFHDHWSHTPRRVGICPENINFTGGLRSDGPMSGGLLLKLIGWYSSDLNLHIKKSPNCAACSVACAPPSVHITPIVMSAPLAAAKARIPRNCMPLSQRHHLPHSCSFPWPPTAVLPFSTTPPPYRHPPPPTPTL